MNQPNKTIFRHKMLEKGTIVKDQFTGQIGRITQVDPDGFGNREIVMVKWNGSNREQVGSVRYITPQIQIQPNK